jgi:hypothetical protein
MITDTPKVEESGLQTLSFALIYTNKGTQYSISTFHVPTKCWPIYVKLVMNELMYRGMP